MDLVNCLNFAREQHGLAVSERNALDAELQRRLPSAMDGAFTLRRFGKLCEYREMLAAQPDVKTRIKCGIARLPRPVANLCANALAR
jgi:hypothetical protein